MAVSEFPWQKGGDLRTGFAVLCGGCYLLNRVMIFLSCRRINKVLLSRTRKEFPTKRSRISSHQTRLDTRGCCALHLKNAKEKAPEETNCIQPYGPLMHKFIRFFRRTIGKKGKATWRIFFRLAGALTPNSARRISSQVIPPQDIGGGWTAEAHNSGGGR